VPIGGSYRLIDVPVSNCLHADIRRIFVLTQFNSESLNRHIAQTYRLDYFSQGFVTIIAGNRHPTMRTGFKGQPTPFGRRCVTSDATRPSII